MGMFCMCIRPDVLLPVVLKLNKLSAFFPKSTLFLRIFPLRQLIATLLSKSFTTQTVTQLLWNLLIT